MLVKGALRLPCVMALVRAMSMSAAEKLVISPSMMAAAPSSAAAIYNIRLAKRSDIPSIRDCNLRNLPENYSDDFFRRHLATWPALSIVATKDDELIGYALGRAEVKRSAVVSRDGSKPAYISPNPSYSGHVTSLAVHSSFRGLGVAKSLMQSLHTQMSVVHNIDEVSLHCRVSNAAAINLYSEFFTYQCAQRVPHYYEDMEDAFLMTVTGLLKEEDVDTSPFLMPKPQL